MTYLDFNDYKEIDIDIQRKLSEEIVEKIKNNYGKIGNLYFEVVLKIYSKINIKIL